MRFVSPETLRLPLENINMLIDKGIDVREITQKSKTSSKQRMLLYVTRIQKERFPDITQYEEVKKILCGERGSISSCQGKNGCNAPLTACKRIDLPCGQRPPRGGILDRVQNGLYIRMALLAAFLGQA